MKLKTFYGWFIQHDALTMPRWLWLLLAVAMVVDVNINVN